MSRVDELARESVAAELVRLRAENERLRAALQQIVDGADTGWSAIGIARRAVGDERDASGSAS